MIPGDSASDPGDPYDLNRFISAQEGVYDRALAELRGGQKRSHWMWYIFPRAPGGRCCTRCVEVGLMDHKRVCCSGVILAELIQGAKSEKELEILRDFRHVFEFLDESTDLWQAAGELSNTLQRKGKSVGLSDCYLAVSAKVYKVKILTLDRHFDVIKGAVGIGLYEVR